MHGIGSAQAAAPPTLCPLLLLLLLLLLLRLLLEALLGGTVHIHEPILAVQVLEVLCLGDERQAGMGGGVAPASGKQAGAPAGRAAGGAQPAPLTLVALLWLMPEAATRSSDSSRSSLAWNLAT
jgi:hypothetical protein